MQEPSRVQKLSRWLQAEQGYLKEGGIPKGTVRAVQNRAGGPTQSNTHEQHNMREQHNVLEGNQYMSRIVSSIRPGQSKGCEQSKGPGQSMHLSRATCHGSAGSMGKTWLPEQTKELEQSKVLMQTKERISNAIGMALLYRQGTKRHQCPRHNSLPALPCK